jgi:hypothetical protein
MKLESVPRLGTRVPFGSSAVEGPRWRPESGVAKEARTRGFATPAFAGCAFVEGECDRLTKQYQGCQEAVLQGTVAYRISSAWLRVEQHSQCLHLCLRAVPDFAIPHEGVLGPPHAWPRTLRRPSRAAAARRPESAPGGEHLRQQTGGGQNASLQNLPSDGLAPVHEDRCC